MTTSTVPPTLITMTTLLGHPGKMTVGPKFRLIDDQMQPASTEIIR